MEPIIDETPRMKRLMHQRFWPQFTPVYCGIDDSGAYDVQPAAAWPPSTKKPASMITPADRPHPERQHVEHGKAMSRAPIMSGIRKLPKPPARIGMTTKKIMMVACIVKAML
jgi:hypothetical protein